MFLFIFLLFLAVPSCRNEGSPQLSFRAARMVGTGDIAVFLLIFNDGKGDDTLLGCSLKEYPSARGEIHDVVDGVMKPLDGLTVRAGDMTVLEAGSLHLMFFGLPEDIGESITVVLRFKYSGSVEVPVPVS